jgi:hypothetical protein
MATKYNKSGADFSPSKPNTVWVQAKYRNTGNAILGVRIWDGQQMRPWRFGRPRQLVNGITHIQIEDEAKPIILNTDRVYQYLTDKAESGEIYKQDFTMNRVVNSGYVVKISDLTLFANITDYPMVDTGIGA